jgi:O-acetyl-ADP-ribose deacetylase (regulator of RNase III)
MQIILSAVENSLADAWEKFCGDLDFVSIHRGSILDLYCDAVISPANSYGFMDGGIDGLYLDYFGREIQARVRRQIYDHHRGELVVGNADIVETGDPKIPFLIIAPTMRVPMVLYDSVNPYLAARAIFLLVSSGIFLSGTYQGKKIEGKVQTIAIPGLGTGVGKVGYNTCAHQVRQAIGDILLGNYRMPQSWAEASERHQLLYTDKLKRLQY